MKKFIDFHTNTPIDTQSLKLRLSSFYTPFILINNLFTYYLLYLLIICLSNVELHYKTMYIVCFLK